MINMEEIDRLISEASKLLSEGRIDRVTPYATLAIAKMMQADRKIEPEINFAGYM